eukprot:COSAG02_NODE_64352_length_260_cov_2.242236_1_plen_25_part_10
MHARMPDESATGPRVEAPIDFWTNV